MNGIHVYATKQFYPQLNNLLECRLKRIKEILGFSLEKSVTEKR